MVKRRRVRRGCAIGNRLRAVPFCAAARAGSTAHRHVPPCFGIGCKDVGLRARAKAMRGDGSCATILRNASMRRRIISSSAALRCATPRGCFTSASPRYIRMYPSVCSGWTRRLRRRCVRYSTSTRPSDTSAAAVRPIRNIAVPATVAPAAARGAEALVRRALQRRRRIGRIPARRPRL